MTTLREAAQQALEACEQRLPLKGQAAIIDELNALRAALVEDAMQKFTDVSQEIEAALAEPKQDGCDHCNHPMYVAIKCRVCGRVTEPVQEPYAWMSVGGSIWRHKTTEDDVPLYTAPRKPLAEWQINDLMSDIDPEDRDSWSFRQGVYAAEKHHGVRR